MKHFAEQKASKGIKGWSCIDDIVQQSKIRWFLCISRSVSHIDIFSAHKRNLLKDWDDEQNVKSSFAMLRNETKEYKETTLGDL